VAVFFSLALIFMILAHEIKDVVVERLDAKSRTIFVRVNALAQALGSILEARPN